MRDTPPLTRLIIPALFVAALFFVQYQRAQEETPMWRVQGEVMGTTYTVQVVHAKAPNAEALHASLEAVNQRMSTYLKSSELNALNDHKSGEPFTLSAPLYTVLKAAQEVSEASEGAFDVTVGPLVNAWGFGPDGRVTPPTAERALQLKAHTGFHKLTLTQKKGEGEGEGEQAQALKADPELYVDLSAIAKGYGVDEAARYLEAQGYQDFWVEVGGEVRVRGVNAEGVPWRAGVERPAGKGRRAVYMVLPLLNTTLATSGDYRNHYLDAEGVSRSHTIDPRTAAPITHRLASVSVLHNENMYADAWATTLNVLGPTEGLKLANKEGLAALFLVRAEGAAQGDLNAPLSAIMSEAMEAYLKERGVSLPEPP